MINQSSYSKSTAAGPGDYPKRRGALSAFNSACRHANEHPTGVLPPDDWRPTTEL